MDAGKQFENTVMRELRRRGWDVQWFGQGLLSPRFRRYLQDVEPPARERWLPDMIAARRELAGMRIVYLDPKGGEKWRETGNHDVEVAALDGAEGWEAFTRGVVYFVFGDGSVLTAEDIRPIARPAPYNGNGSGTPFVIFPCGRNSRTFDEVFGLPSDKRFAVADVDDVDAKAEALSTAILASLGELMPCDRCSSPIPVGPVPLCSDCVSALQGGRR